MIRGTGIDIVDIQRIREWLNNTDLLKRYFSDDEISYVQSKGHHASASLAARFAAKEAFGKALGTGLRGIRLKDIEVVLDPNGKPELHLKGSALEALKQNGAGAVFLSLSHDSSLSIAQVIIEEASGG
ncbi:holo-ACP synthase [Oceanispirochaeta crateris]|uniref:Holo-[acyl-carrier-protein] synthase n=1 Tax=Oceanispirochaeta crateris TaxID=2518645 RepID=A0A5C1QI59_9SPIO|nr:holo-ACP synthase [Oceanispirochaeta crateris]QEN07835.1 holo-ACP synthase [Oceanispirochaeta crateris]